MKFASWFTILALAAVLPVRADLADGVKAIVNDSIITYAQVEQFTAPAADVLRRQYADQPDVYQQKLTQALNDSLEELVKRQLVLHDFDVEGYKLPDGVIDDLVTDRIRERFGDRITLMKTLQSQGMTFEQFRKDIQDQYIISVLRNQNISREIVISPYKVENYYLAHQDDFKLEDQIKLRMIVLNKNATDDTNTVALAGEIHTKLKEGAAFEEMASVYSQGSQKSQGGDWGWIEPGKLRKELADAAAKLKVGQFSDVIETPESCYLMYVEQERPAHVKPLNDVRDEIEKNLRAQEQANLETAWYESLKKKTFIRYF